MENKKFGELLTDDKELAARYDRTNSYMEDTFDDYQKLSTEDKGVLCLSVLTNMQLQLSGIVEYNNSDNRSMVYLKSKGKTVAILPLILNRDGSLSDGRHEFTNEEHYISSINESMVGDQIIDEVKFLEFDEVAVIYLYASPESYWESLKILGITAGHMVYAVEVFYGVKFNVFYDIDVELLKSSDEIGDMLNNETSLMAFIMDGEEILTITRIQKHPQGYITDGYINFSAIEEYMFALSDNMPHSVSISHIDYAVWDDELFRARYDDVDEYHESLKKIGIPTWMSRVLSGLESHDEISDIFQKSDGLSTMLFNDM